jgi:hypothetical protein
MVNREDFAFVADANSDEAAGAAQGADLACEFSGLMHDDHLVAVQSGTQDLDASGEDHQERTIAVAGFREYLVAMRAKFLAVRLETRDLLRRELRERLRFTFDEYAGHGRSAIRQSAAAAIC